jgi:type VI secretion system protein ImpM
MTAAASPVAGFCGKLPIRADFLIRRVPLACVEPWHDWMAQWLISTRAALGDAWLDAYLYGPIWRFALPAGLVGPSAVAGTLMPSVDSVGRYFPLTIALQMRSTAALAAVVVGGESWFSGAEELSLAALEGELDPDALSERLAALALPPAGAGRTDAKPIPALAEPGLVLSFDPEKESVEALLARYAPTQLDAGNSVWWTLGGESFPPVMLLAVGLPAPSSFAAMLSGQWAAQGWREDRNADAGALEIAAEREGTSRG